MDNLSIIEDSYRKYIKNLSFWIPEGIINVDLDILHKFNLLNFQNHKLNEDDSLTRYFHVIESLEKITLVNEQFIVWIVPENIEGVPTTYALIALNHPSGPLLETVFATSGVYNTSWLVLRILEKFLQEIQENEELIKRYKAS